MTDESLFVTSRHAAKFAMDSDSTDSQLWSGGKKSRCPSYDYSSQRNQRQKESRSSSNTRIEDSVPVYTPATSLGKATLHLEESPSSYAMSVQDTSCSSAGGQPLESASQPAPSTANDSARSKPYKTPKTTVVTTTTQANISAKDKVVVFNVPVEAAASRSADWIAPEPCSAVVDSACKSKEDITELVYTLKHDYKWTVFGCGEKPYLNSIENQVFVVPFGRYSTSGRASGFENIEYFTELNHFVTHIQRNPVIIHDFATIWKALEKQGWCKSSSFLSSSSEPQYRFRFPAASTVLSNVMPTNADQSAVSNMKGIHDFHCQAAVHLYVMRFPYPLQEDAVLADTLQAMGWTSRPAGTFFHPLFNDRLRKGATLDEVRHLLWTDPTLLCAKGYVNNDAAELSTSLRAAFKIPDETNATSPNEDVELNDKNVLKILNIVEGHMGKETEIPLKSGDGDVWWKFSKKEVKQLESLLVDGCGWRIAEDGVKVNNWWKHFKAYLPDFHPPSPSKKGTTESYIPGVSIFWTLDDAVKYISRFGNLPPVNEGEGLLHLRVNHAEHDEANYKSLVSCDAFNALTDFHSLGQTLLDDYWSMTRINPTSLKEFYPTIKGDRVVQGVFAASWVKGLTDDGGMLDLNNIVLDKDFFFFEECVINYLKVRNFICSSCSHFLSLFVLQN